MLAGEVLSRAARNSAGLRPNWSEGAHLASLSHATDVRIRIRGERPWYTTIIEREVRDFGELKPAEAGTGNEQLTAC